MRAAPDAGQGWGRVCEAFQVGVAALQQLNTTINARERPGRFRFRTVSLLNQELSAQLSIGLAAFFVLNRGMPLETLLVQHVRWLFWGKPLY